MSSSAPVLVNDLKVLAKKRFKTDSILETESRRYSLSSQRIALDQSNRIFQSIYFITWHYHPNLVMPLPLTVHHLAFSATIFCEVGVFNLNKKMTMNVKRTSSIGLGYRNV